MNKTLMSAVLIGGIFILAVAYPLQSQVKEQHTTLQSSEKKTKAIALCREAKDKRDLYFKIWKKQFLKRNNMAETYFDSHIAVTKYDIDCQWISGLAFRVQYNLTYDWAIINHQDQIVVLLYEREEAYRHLPIKRDHLFDEEEVSYAIDKNVFFSSITPVQALDKMGFLNYEEARQAFQKEVGGEKLDGVRLSFYVPGKLPREDGYPYLIGRVVIDWTKNLCIEGYMNLVTGKTVSWKNACVIN